MKVILAGGSRYTEAFESALAEHGFEIETAADAKSLLSLSGIVTREALQESGESGITYAEPARTEITAPVVLLHDAKLPAVLTDDKALFAAVSGLAPQDVTVFLLDSQKDTAPYAEQLVIAAAAKLAAKKRRIVVLMRSSRAPNESFEDEYRDARNLGVTFIKYESLTIEPGEESVNLTVFDGKLLITLESSLLIDCTESPSLELEALAKVLRLKTYGGGLYAGSRWFLSEDDTFRRNVKLIDTLSIKDFDAEIKALVFGLKTLAKPSQELAAYVDPIKCAFCYTCYRVCPHAALGPDSEKKAMKADPLLCAACGLCVSVCPASAISFEEAAAGKLDSKAKSADAPKGDTTPVKGKLKAFCCENSAFIAAGNELATQADVIEKVPCGGDVSAETLTKALADFDKVLVAVCCDEGCKHFDGNKRLIKQVARLKGRLEALGLDSERLSCVQVGVTMTNILADAAKNALAAKPVTEESAIARGEGQ